MDGGGAVPFGCPAVVAAEGVEGGVGGQEFHGGGGVEAGVGTVFGKHLACVQVLDVVGGFVWPQFAPVEIGIGLGGQGQKDGEQE